MKKSLVIVILLCLFDIVTQAANPTFAVVKVTGTADFTGASVLGVAGTSGYYSGLSVGNADYAASAGSASSVDWSNISSVPSLVYNDGGYYGISVNSANTAASADVASVANSLQGYSAFVTHIGGVDGDFTLSGDFTQDGNALGINTTIARVTGTFSGLITSTGTAATLTSGTALNLKSGGAVPSPVFSGTATGSYSFTGTQGGTMTRTGTAIGGTVQGGRLSGTTTIAAGGLLTGGSSVYPAAAAADYTQRQAAAFEALIETPSDMAAMCYSDASGSGFSKGTGNGVQVLQASGATTGYADFYGIAFGDGVMKNPCTWVYVVDYNAIHAISGTNVTNCGFTVGAMAQSGTSPHITGKGWECILTGTSIIAGIYGDSGLVTTSTNLTSFNYEWGRVMMTWDGSSLGIWLSRVKNNTVPSGYRPTNILNLSGTITGYTASISVSCNITATGTANGVLQVRGMRFKPYYP